MLPNFAYTRPDTLKEAVKQLGSEEARLHAGGTDLLGCLRDGVFSAQKVVSISKLDALRGITKTSKGGLEIGTLTTITAVAEHPLIQSDFTALANAAGEVASPQLRNQGTLGGATSARNHAVGITGENLTACAKAVTRALLLKVKTSIIACLAVTTPASSYTRPIPRRR